MTEKSEPSRSEEERRREAEKLKAEVERSLEAARAKLAHGLIESITKQRKLPSVRSLLERMNFHAKTIGVVIESLLFPKQASLTFSLEERELVQEMIRTYESIREDFKEVMEMDDNKLEKLFPKLTTNFEERMGAIAILTNIRHQETQMGLYSSRIFL